MPNGIGDEHSSRLQPSIHRMLQLQLLKDLSHNMKLFLFCAVAPKIDATDATDYNISAILDHPVIISCPVSGTPFPNIAWFKDNIPLSLEENKNVRVLSNGQKLEISSVSVEDAGRYKCLAKNEAGKDDREYELTVWGEHLPITLLVIEYYYLQY